MQNVKTSGKTDTKTTESTIFYYEKEKLREDIKLKHFKLRYLFNSLRYVGFFPQPLRFILSL